ncbi:conjugal transfer protein MobB, partial [uncultured Duncaniella sp.]|uniref:conjugal transfer protein MobB n=1 Tax=uncultured Duncaniella sp. TaxID=2768039 RepID=UPI00262BD9A5
MVAKISIGSSLYGAISYNGEKINEAKGRILGSNKVVIPPDGHVDVARMVEDFKSFMPKMGRTKKPVLHISLNPHPEDRLTDQDFEILAREYLDKLGFGEQPWVMYKHEDIDRHHIHIVTVNVNEQGKRLNQDFLYRRSKKITTELEEKYGLHKAQREKISPDTPITKIDLSGDIKRQVQNTVKLVGMRWKFQTLGEFNAILSLYNIRCEPTDGKVNGREYHGYVYHATNDKGETIATPFKASRLGKFASRTAVEGMFERAKDKIDIKPTKRIVVDVMARSNGKEDFITNLKEKG